MLKGKGTSSSFVFCFLLFYSYIVLIYIPTNYSDNIHFLPSPRLSVEIIPVATPKTSVSVFLKFSSFCHYPLFVLIFVVTFDIKRVPRDLTLAYNDAAKKHSSVYPAKIMKNCNWKSCFPLRLYLALSTERKSFSLSGIRENIRFSVFGWS